MNRSAADPLSAMNRVRRRALRTELACGLARGCIASAAVMLAAAGLDLVLEMPAALRLGAWFAAAGALTTAVGAAWGRHLRLNTPDALARRLDLFAGTAGQIRSGVDLQLNPVAGGPRSAALAALAMRRAAELAAGVDPARVMSNRPAGKAWAAVAGLLAALGIGAICLPQPARTLWLRFSDPFGDHPPWSPIFFDVQPGHTRVIFGQGIQVQARLHGGTLEELELVLCNARGSETHVVPMFAAPDGAWRASIARVTEGGGYFIRGGRARSHRYQLELIPVPLIEDVQVRITPPAYTRRPIYEGPLPVEGIEGLPGTSVQIRLRGNQPLKGARVTMTTTADATTFDWPNHPDDVREVIGSFTLHAAGRAEVEIIDQTGVPSADRLIIPLHLLNDAPPTVRLNAPPAFSLATPTATLPVELAAEDDHGIRRLTLYRSLNHSPPLPLELSPPEPDPTRFRHRMTIPLAPLRLRPGDIIELFAHVEDNRPARSQVMETATTRIRIISEEQFMRIQRTRGDAEDSQIGHEAADQGRKKGAGQTQPGKTPVTRADDVSSSAEPEENPAAQGKDSTGTPRDREVTESDDEPDEALTAYLQQTAADGHSRSPGGHFNIGLYGRAGYVPEAEGKHGWSSDDRLGDAQADDREISDLLTPQRAAGGAGAPLPQVPARYLRRVGAYFERIARDAQTRPAW